MSRILAKFEARQFVVREPCQDDARQSRLKLTEDGRAAFGPLDAASRAQIESLLTPLSSMARSDLVAAMATIQPLPRRRNAPAPCLADRGAPWRSESAIRVLSPLLPASPGWCRNLTLRVRASTRPASVIDGPRTGARGAAGEALGPSSGGGGGGEGEGGSLGHLDHD